MTWVAIYPFQLVFFTDRGRKRSINRGPDAVFFTLFFGDEELAECISLVVLRAVDNL